MYTVTFKDGTKVQREVFYIQVLSDFEHVGWVHVDVGNNYDSGLISEKELLEIAAMLYDLPADNYEERSGIRDKHSNVVSVEFQDDDDS